MSKRRTSSDFNIGKVRQKEDLSQSLSKPSLPRSNTQPADFQISKSSKSSSFSTALALTFNFYTVRLPSLPVSHLKETKFHSQKDTSLLQVSGSNKVRISTQLENEVDASYYSVDAGPMESIEQITKKKDLDHEKYNVRPGKNDKVFNNEMEYINGNLVNDLIKIFGHFSKTQTIFSEIIIAVAFCLPYLTLDRNELMILLVVNCSIIFTVVQMKKRYAVQYHTIWSLSLLFIHQTMLMYLNSVFIVDKNQISTFLLLIFTSCSLVNFTMYPTLFIIVYSSIINITLSVVSQVSIEWESYSMVLLIYIYSAIVALLTSHRNVQTNFQKGTKLLRMKNHIEQVNKDVKTLDNIAYSLLPDYVWKELKEGKHGAFTGNINKGLRYEYPRTSILFADVVGFTSLSSKIDKDELLKVLNHVFTRFDKIAEMHDMEKIKTVGDCYVCVGGIMTDPVDCGARCALMGLKMVKAMTDIQNSGLIPPGLNVSLRIGAHVGSAIGGLIGDTKMLFDIWSKDVSIASLMEQTGAPNRVHCSKDLHDEIKGFCIAEPSDIVTFQDKKYETLFLESIIVNQSFLSLPFVEKCCKRKIVKNSTLILTKGESDWYVDKHSPFQLKRYEMFFKETQLENEYIRKKQQNSIALYLVSTLFGLVLVAAFGTLSFYRSNFNQIVGALFALAVIIQLLIFLIFASVYYKNSVSFDQLGHIERVLYKFGVEMQSKDWDILLLTEFLLMYTIVLLNAISYDFQLQNVHNSFYICIISGFLFQDMRFPYFFTSCLLVISTYIYCVSVSKLLEGDILGCIFYCVCLLVCILNNYSLNYLNRVFYRLDILNQEKLFVLQDQLQKTNKTVLKLLPFHIVDVLKSGITEFSEGFTESAVMFCEITGLSNYPKQADLLNEIISRIDKSLFLYPGVVKVKTVYSVYMAASGITPDSKLVANHIKSTFDFAISIKKMLSAFNKSGYQLGFKIGISIGPIVGGVVGKSKLTFDIWGDTVNVASRMESTADMQMIQVTEAAYLKVSSFFRFEERGPIYVKGKGHMNTYILLGKRKKEDK